MTLLTDRSSLGMASSVTISNWLVTTTHLDGALQGGHPPRQLRDLGDGDKRLEVPRQLLHGLNQVRRLAVLVALHRPLQLVCGGRLGFVYGHPT